MNEVKILFYEKSIKENQKIIEQCKDQILFAEEKLKEIKNEHKN